MRNVGAGILTVIAVLVSAATAFAQGGAQEKSKVVYGLPIPDRVGSLVYVYGQTVDFESKSTATPLRFGGSAGLDIRPVSLRSRTEDHTG